VRCGHKHAEQDEPLSKLSQSGQRSRHVRDKSGALIATSPKTIFLSEDSRRRHSLFLRQTDLPLTIGFSGYQHEQVKVLDTSAAPASVHRSDTRERTDKVFVSQFDVSVQVSKILPRTGKILTMR